MKNWEVPAVEELDVKLTANGYWDFYVEFFGEANDNKLDKNEENKKEQEAQS